MYLYGASGHAKVIIDILKSMNIPIKGFFDDNPSIQSMMDYPVFHKKALSEIQEPIIISIGNNKIRRNIASSLNATFGKAIYKGATISETVQIGEGTVVMQGAIIQSSSIIGKHTIINTAANIDHDCTIGDFVHISPNATLCGNVIVGEGTHIGAGAIVIPGIRIGKWSVVGAGTVVIRDVPDNVTVVGNPSRILNKTKNQ